MELKTYFRMHGPEEYQSKNKQIQLLTNFCNEYGFDLSDEDMQELEKHDLVDEYKAIKESIKYDEPEQITDIWHVECYTKQDVIQALQQEAIPATPRNVKKFEAFAKQCWSKEHQKKRNIDLMVQRFEINQHMKKWNMKRGKHVSKRKTKSFTHALKNYEKK